MVTESWWWRWLRAAVVEISDSPWSSVCLYDDIEVFLVVFSPTVCDYGVPLRRCGAAFCFGQRGV